MNFSTVSKHAANAVVLGLLFGCGGGADSSSTGGPNLSFGSDDAAAAALIGTYLDQNGQPVGGLTRSTSFATTSSAQYNGAIRGNLRGDAILADLSLAVNFGAGDVSGTAHNFQSERTGSFSGSLNGLGRVDGAASAVLPQMTVVLRGSLSDAGGSHDSALLLDGNFYAQGGDPEGALAGTVDGNIGTDPFGDGLFAAQK